MSIPDSNVILIRKRFEVNVKASFRLVLFGKWQIECNYFSLSGIKIRKMNFGEEKAGVHNSPIRMQNYMNSRKVAGNTIE